MKWLPTRYTKPLSEDFPSSGDTVIGIAEAFIRLPERNNDKLVLTEWQKWLIRSVLERYPKDHPDPEKAGRLRYKQVVISIPRKNGKSLLGSLFALYGLIAHESGAEVISVASSADQANIVYRNVLNQIRQASGYVFNLTQCHTRILCQACASNHLCSRLLHRDNRFVSIGLNGFN